VSEDIPVEAKLKGTPKNSVMELTRLKFNAKKS
jgi:hypothetical protein